MSYVPVVTSLATSAVTVTAAIPTETIDAPALSTIDPYIYSSDASPTVMTISPIMSSLTVTVAVTSFTQDIPMTTATVSTIVGAPAAPLANAAPWIEVNTGNTSVVIGDTCRAKHKQAGRDKKIQECVAAHLPRNKCTAYSFACDCYQLRHAVQCYKPEYHDCKKDGMSLCPCSVSLTYADHRFRLLCASCCCSRTGL